jgi:hypothetical protein
MNNSNDKKIPKTVDDAIRAMRSDDAPDSVVREAGDRVWSKISGESNALQLERISGCADVQSLLSAYSDDELSPERALIVEDHLRDCVACRHVLHQDQTSIPAAWAQPVAMPVANPFWDTRRFAVAAMLLFVIGVSAYFVNGYFAPLPGNRATLQSANGPVYLLASNSQQPLLPGHELNEGEIIRTGAGSHAVVKLFDGSLIEMNERAEFSVSARRTATTIHLGRGNIIVQAAKQHGHLYVVTHASKVSVTGTVFTVNSGMKGDRVSVIEGEVHVEEDGTENILHSGDQIATSESMGSVPIESEIAWSQNREQHLALLAEFSKLQKKFEGIPGPALRYESAILPITPEQTLIYASVPNYGDQIAEANRMFQDQLQQSQVLRQWWQSNGVGKDNAKFQEMVERVRTLSQYLGNEVVFMLVPGYNGKGAAMVVVAQVTRPGLRDFLQSEIDKNVDANHRDRISVYDEAGAAKSAGSQHGHISIMAGEKLLLASSDGVVLQGFASRTLEGGNTGFAGSSFGQAISASYQEGAGLLFATDLEKMIVHASLHTTAAAHERHMAGLQQSGFAQARHLVVKRREQNGETDNRATLTFNSQRQGIASWLAAPSGLGSLDFVSPDAVIVTAAAMKSPAGMVDDLLGLMRRTGGNPDTEMAKFRTEMNFDLREELAATLGGDFAMAVDGPVLPTPSWKFVVEVNDPSKLQSTLQMIVQDINTKASAHGHAGVSLEQVEDDGRVFYTVKSLNLSSPLELHYTFVSGYLVATPSQALLLKAIKIRESGITLANSSRFKSLLPKDGHTNASGVIYQNLASVAGPLGEQLNPQEAQSLQVIAGNAAPSLICAYGDEDRIEIATNSKFFGLDVNNLALSQLLRMAPGTKSNTNP